MTLSKQKRHLSKQRKINREVKKMRLTAPNDPQPGQTAYPNDPQPNQTADFSDFSQEEDETDESSPRPPPSSSNSAALNEEDSDEDHSEKIERDMVDANSDRAETDGNRTETDSNRTETDEEWDKMDPGQFSKYWLRGGDISEGDDDFNRQLQGMQPSAFDKIFKAESPVETWKKAEKGRPAWYTGVAPRTIRRKKAALKNAAEGTQLITSYFSPIVVTKTSLEEDAEKN
jgi:hypothetical protein